VEGGPHQNVWLHGFAGGHTHWDFVAGDLSLCIWNPGKSQEFGWTCRYFDLANTVMVLNNRFARYLRLPPTLAIHESAADKQLI
jgi:hypothetical protein